MVWVAVMAAPPALATSRHGRAFTEFAPPVVRPQQEQVVVQARQTISLSCEGHRPVTSHTPTGQGDQDKGARLRITNTQNQRNKNKFISTISLRDTVYKDTGELGFHLV